MKKACLRTEKQGFWIYTFIFYEGIDVLRIAKQLVGKIVYGRAFVGKSSLNCINNVRFLRRNIFCNQLSIFRNIAFVSV